MRHWDSSSSWPRRANIAREWDRVTGALDLQQIADLRYVENSHVRSLASSAPSMIAALTSTAERERASALGGNLPIGLTCQDEQLAPGADVYLDHSYARGHDDMNLFLVDDWARLEPRCFLLETEDT